MKKKNLVEVKSLPGVKLPEMLARQIDQLTKTLPKDCQYKRKGVLPQSTEIALTSGERADISLVSVESVDRDNEIVLAKGMDLTLFQRNPVVTFAHKYDELPIGKAQWIKRVEGGVKAKTLYAERPQGWEGNWLPDACFSLVLQEVLRGKSVGFLPTKIRSPTKEEVAANPHWKNANAVIETSSLIEYAIAPIPVNQDALVEAVAKGFTKPDLLKRLGLTVPQKKAIKKKAKPVDLVALFIKELEKIKIDPNKVVEIIKQKYTV